MSECLPLAIREKVEEGFLGTVTAEVIAKSEVGISCSVTVKDRDGGKELQRLFVKYLEVGENNTSDFGEESAVYFSNEMLFYGEISRQFEKIERAAGPLTCAPKCLSVGNADVPFIIMEDLHRQGYAPLDLCSSSFAAQQAGAGGERTTVQRTRIVLQELGKFHAYSFAMKDRRPREFKTATSKMRETVFAQRTSRRKNIFVESIHDAYKLAKQALPADSIYTGKLADFTLNVYNNMSALTSRDDDYSVVTHGDLWPSNVLWNADENSVKFVDFQACRYASPVHDVVLFLLTSLDRTTRNDHLQDFLASYHLGLCRKLEELGCDPLRLFPRSALDAQLVEHARFAMALALVGLPLFFNEAVVINTAAANTPVIGVENAENSDINENNDDDDDEEDGEKSEVAEEDEEDALVRFIRNVRANKSAKCKSKMLEIMMDVIDQGWLG